MQPPFPFCDSVIPSRTFTYFCESVGTSEASLRAQARMVGKKGDWLAISDEAKE